MKYISYTLATFMTIAMLLIFINMEQWMKMTSKLPFMKVDPWLSGGEIVDSVITDSSRIYIHEIANPGLFPDKTKEMVQFDFYGVVNDSIVDKIIDKKQNDFVKSSKTKKCLIVRVYRSK